MPKKENNRKNFTGYKNWQERKAKRNLLKHQLAMFSSGTPENPVYPDFHWEHVTGPNPLRKDV